MADKEKVLHDLAMAWGIVPIRESELTAVMIHEAAKEIGIELSRNQVQRKLKMLKDEGVLSSRQLATGNCLAYSPCEDKTWEDVLQYIKKK